jgi:hypothetical protein
MFVGGKINAGAQGVASCPPVGGVAKGHALSSREGLQRKACPEVRRAAWSAKPDSPNRSERACVRSGLGWHAQKSVR